MDRAPNPAERRQPRSPLGFLEEYYGREKEGLVRHLVSQSDDELDELIDYYDDEVARYPLPRRATSELQPLCRLEGLLDHALDERRVPVRVDRICALLLYVPRVVVAEPLNAELRWLLEAKRQPDWYQSSIMRLSRTIEAMYLLRPLTECEPAAVYWWRVPKPQLLFELDRSAAALTELRELTGEGLADVAGSWSTDGQIPTWLDESLLLLGKRAFWTSEQARDAVQRLLLIEVQDAVIQHSIAQREGGANSIDLLLPNPMATRLYETVLSQGNIDQEPHDVSRISRTLQRLLSFALKVPTTADLYTARGTDEFGEYQDKVGRVVDGILRLDSQIDDVEYNRLVRRIMDDELGPSFTSLQRRLRRLPAFRTALRDTKVDLAWSGLALGAGAGAGAGWYDVPFPLDKVWPAALQHGLKRLVTAYREERQARPRPCLASGRL